MCLREFPPRTPVSPIIKTCTLGSFSSQSPWPRRWFRSVLSAISSPVGELNMLVEFRRAFVSSDTDVGREGLAWNFHSSSCQRCLMGLRSGLCVGQSSSSTQNSSYPAFMDLAKDPMQLSSQCTVLVLTWMSEVGWNSSVIDDDTSIFIRINPLRWTISFSRGSAEHWRLCSSALGNPAL